MICLDNDKLIVQGYQKILKVNEDDKPMWWVEINWDDPEVDRFDNSITVYLNKKFKTYPKSVNDSEFLCTIIATVYFLIIKKLKEKDKELEIDKEKEVKPQKRFTKPTLEEVQAYCQERNNNVDAQKWFDHYSSNGWKVGRNAMKDWKASVRNWERSVDYGETTHFKKEVKNDVSSNSKRNGDEYAFLG